MRDDEHEIRPETYALDTLIRETLARVSAEGATSLSDSLLFLGNRHHAFPVLVIQDPVLEPVDKLVWMVICQSARGTGVNAIFPTYEAIARMANVSSTATVSRAIAILRLTRWLSLCARRRDDGGRFQGNVYSLHDEPLPLADALHLDPAYMRFLDEVTRHHHARVRRVAVAVSDSLDDAIRAGSDVLAPESVIERRLKALRALSGEAGERHYFSFSGASLARLARPVGHQDQNSKAVEHPQNSKTVGSSSNNKKTTTTSIRSDQDAGAREPAWLAALTLPKRLVDNQRALAARYLTEVPEALRQIVLDELEGRFQAERRGAKPIHDELRYLYRLCVAARRGHLHPNLGLKVRDQRERERKARTRERDAAAACAQDGDAAGARSRVDAHLAEARKKLGITRSR
ncbi:MAG: STY4528 family pathogenicity island replication protein [Gammaproteobacteria bacterium]